MQVFVIYFCQKHDYIFDFLPLFWFLLHLYQWSFLSFLVFISTTYLWPLSLHPEMSRAILIVYSIFLCNPVFLYCQFYFGGCIIFVSFQAFLISFITFYWLSISIWSLIFPLILYGCIFIQHTGVLGFY